jgi:hypothetical protein
MELKGKCKQDFENYYTNWMIQSLKKREITTFNRLNNSMRYGVYVDFFDSVGIYITTSWDLNINAFNWWCESERAYSGKEKTRPEAGIAAIEKANEIYNLNNHERQRNKYCEACGTKVKQETKYCDLCQCKGNEAYEK